MWPRTFNALRVVQGCWHSSKLLEASSAVSACPCYAPEMCARLLSLKGDDSGSVDESGGQTGALNARDFFSGATSFINSSRLFFHRIRPGLIYGLKTPEVNPRLSRTTAAVQKHCSFMPSPRRCPSRKRRYRPRTFGYPCCERGRSAGCRRRTGRRSRGSCR